MTFSFASAFADAGALWRRERGLLAPIAGVFFFLPALGFGMMMVPDTSDPQASAEQAQAAIVAMFEANLPWVIATTLVQEFGALAILLLLLGKGRESVGDALLRATRLYPAFLLISGISGLVVMLGAVALLIPGLYAQGRLLLAPASFAAAPERGPTAAIVEGVTASHARGWLLFAFWGVVFVWSMLAATVVRGLFDPLIAATGNSIIANFAMFAGVAAVSAAGALALTLLRVACYRRLVEKQGI